MQKVELISNEPKIAVLRQSRPSSDQLKKNLGKWPEGTLRIVPLLAVVEIESLRHVFVGSTAIYFQHGKLVELCVWVEDEATVSADGSVVKRDTDDLQDMVLSQIESRIADGSASEPIENELAAAATSKLLTENSLAVFGKLRDIRYDLERQLINPGNRSNSAVVASLTLLGIILGKCADQARRAVREGFWLWIANSDIYHAYRKHRDPLILKQRQISTSLPDWIGDHDSASRHCQSLADDLQEESQHVRALLVAASSISTAYEADAQSRLNWIVASLSIAVGIPGLVFSLYGANNFEGLKEWAGGVWLLGVLLTAAFGIAAWVLRAKHKSLWILSVACGLMVSVVLLALWLAPMPPPGG